MNDWDVTLAWLFIAVILIALDYQLHVQPVLFE